MLETITTKICNKCKVEKEINKFSFRNDTQDHRKQCKECISSMAKERYIENIEKQKAYQLKNKDKIKEYKRKKYIANSEEIKEKRRQYCKNKPEKIKNQKKEYYLKHKEYVKSKTKEYYFENIADIKIKSKEYRDNNFEKIKEKKKEYNTKNIEAVRERHRRYMKTEKGKLIAKNMKHRRRTAEKIGDVTTEQLKNLYENTTHCYWCNTKLKKEYINLDHYMPIAKGGLHTISNLVLSCSNCNKSKSHKDPIKFAIEKGRLL